MMNILEKIVKDQEANLNSRKNKVSLEEIKKLAKEKERGEFKFEKALKKTGISFICECKKASPSKGIIDSEFDYLKIAKEYEEAGADMISVLTEENYFLGSIDYLKEISNEVNIPCLRKDFIVDEYMIYEAKVYGASAILLIVSLLDSDKLKRFIEIADFLGLSSLVEVHDEEECKIAINAGARIIGVNNRNLKDFSVNTNNTKNLRNIVPDNILLVSESGIKTKDDIDILADIRVDGVLIGETLMRAEDKKEKLNYLRGNND
ncbi:indole-3-glycerol phosphate synthase TrpC [Peptoniphilus sp. MSJ-1]|uniref:Indole-3-glycerol phosphate synthase n=1 Tax=Peptoniphilus ovalis TaxID=2841503 RepID=A0ABS6FGS1_9FIRM|nr:indole-3-glycerol phosphate synthase TrpC [Peptoniphilus ovalis]MBU5669372.1 indole-3-glycerol phosphate synthase TrpC [Peptoniphilus ovalis]